MSGRKGGRKSPEREDWINPVVASGNVDEEVLTWSANGGMSTNGAKWRIKDLQAVLEQIKTDRQPVAIIQTDYSVVQNNEEKELLQDQLKSFTLAH